MIIITEQAILRIKEMVKEQENNLNTLRFGVTGGGCSGLSYRLGFDEKTERDESFLFDDLEVIIDKEELPIVKGTVIDYKENMLGGGFTINNPNAIASCGCGSSFRTKTNQGTPENC